MPNIQKICRPLMMITPCPTSQFRNLFTTRDVMEKFEIQSESRWIVRVLCNKTKPTLVEFTAPWCTPCTKVVSRIEAAVDDDEVDLAVVNIDRMPELAQEYKVSAIPCLLGFNKEGEIVARLEGIQSEDSIINLVRKISQ